MQRNIKECHNVIKVTQLGHDGHNYGKYTILRGFLILFKQTALSLLSVLARQEGQPDGIQDPEELSN